MKFSDHSTHGANLVRDYSPGELRVGETTLRRSCLLMADRIVADWPPETVDELRVEHFEAIAALAPEVVVLGTGTRQRFPEHRLMSMLLTRGIGIEVMDTGAACRTYNVLVSEDRRVVAALLLRDE